MTSVELEKRLRRLEREILDLRAADVKAREDFVATLFAALSSTTPHGKEQLLHRAMGLGLRETPTGQPTPKTLHSLAEEVVRKLKAFERRIQAMERERFL